MVALEWDRTGRDELVEQGGTRLHLYVAPEELPPSGARAGPGRTAPVASFVPNVVAAPGVSGSSPFAAPWWSW